MIYLKKFLNHQDYESYITGDTAILPNVSLCETEKEVGFNPYVPPEPIRAFFYVTGSTTPSTVRILYSTSNISSVKIDGVEQPSVITGYTFSVAETHTVDYTLIDNTVIPTSGFTGCGFMTSINIPDSVKSIGDYAFRNCGIYSVTIPSGVTSIGNYTFHSSRLISISMPSGITSIGDYAFYNCNFKSIDIQNSTSIGTYAFYNCQQIKSITLGTGLTSIGNRAFDNCRSLDSVTIEATTPPTLGTRVFENNASGRKIYVPSASVDIYKAASGWNDYASDILPIT